MLERDWFSLVSKALFSQNPFPDRCNKQHDILCSSSIRIYNLLAAYFRWQPDICKDARPKFKMQNTSFRISRKTISLIFFLQVPCNKIFHFQRKMCIPLLIVGCDVENLILYSVCFELRFYVHFCFAD